MKPYENDCHSSERGQTPKHEPSNVSIVGSGWLGLALAKHLQLNGYVVRISTTSANKYHDLGDKQYSIHRFSIESKYSLASPENQPFFTCDSIIIAIPPRDVANYQPLIERIQQSGIKRVVLISSTSVYRMTNTDIFESDVEALDPNSKVLAIEQYLQNNLPQITVLRLGGLIGDGRHPVKWFAGKPKIMAANAPVNFIHQEDCVRVLQLIISQPNDGKIFNACADTHPSKAQFYGKLFQQAGIKAPELIEQQPLMYKRVKSDFLKTELNYQFKFGQLENIDFNDLL
jgi:nucleoside-diphosphate-sugar epimerase